MPPTDSGQIPVQGTTPEPPRDCPLCPRLFGYRYENRAAHPDWWNGPAPSFGDPDARLLVVGLAPGPPTGWSLWIARSQPRSAANRRTTSRQPPRKRSAVLAVLIVVPPCRGF